VYKEYHITTYQINQYLSTDFSLFSTWFTKATFMEWEMVAVG